MINRRITECLSLVVYAIVAVFMLNILASADEAMPTLQPPQPILGMPDLYATDEAFRALEDGQSRCALVFGNGNDTDAIRYYDKAIRLYRARGDDTHMLATALADRGDAYARLGQFGVAIADYNEASRVNPDYDNHCQLGDAYFGLRQYDKAIAEYCEVIKEEFRAEDYVDSAEGLKLIEDGVISSRASAYKSRGDAHAQLGQFELAIADYNEACRLDSTQIDLLRTSRGDAYVGLRQYDRAEADYNKNIRVFPTSGDGYEKRGRMYYNIGQYERAIQDCSEAIRFFTISAHDTNPVLAAFLKRAEAPDSAEAYQILTATYAQIATMRMNSNNAEASRLIAAAYAPKVESQMQTTFRITGEQTRPNSNEAFDAFTAGNRLLDSKSYADAIPYYEKAIRLYRARGDSQMLAMTYTNRGRAYLNLKQYDQAIADYTTSLNLQPRYALAYLGRSVAYHGLDQPEKAIADINIAIELDPKNANAYQLRGNYYSWLGRREKAISDFSEANRLKAGLNQ